MSVSLDSQAKAIETIANLRPNDMVRAGVVSRAAEAELLRSQLVAARNTFQFIASDERIRRYLEANTRNEQAHG